MILPLPSINGKNACSTSNKKCTGHAVSNMHAALEEHQVGKKNEARYFLCKMLDFYSRENYSYDAKANSAHANED